jgi:hypothetical protein
MIEMQAYYSAAYYDVLRTIGFRTELLQTLTDGFRFFGELSRAGKIAPARLVARRPCSRSKIGGSGLLSSLGNANGAMVGLILRLSIAAESFTSYVQLSEEALAGAVTGNAPPRRLASLRTALSRLLITNFEKQPV